MLRYLNLRRIFPINSEGDQVNKLRSWIWHKLVYLADRISPEDAFRSFGGGYAVRLRKGEGWVLDKDGVGVPIWYQGEDSYRKNSHLGYED